MAGNEPLLIACRQGPTVSPRPTARLLVCVCFSLSCVCVCMVEYEDWGVNRLEGVLPGDGGHSAPSRVLWRCKPVFFGSFGSAG